jgi:hypothetical protein
MLNSVGTNLLKPSDQVQSFTLKNIRWNPASSASWADNLGWIKEALVAEGLLDKVYKNDELNADTVDNNSWSAKVD